MNDRREPPAELGPRTAEASWTVEGPNSGGIAGWWLYQGYMHWFRHEGHSGSVDRGMPVAEWLSRYADVHPGIADALRSRSAPT